MREMGGWQFSKEGEGMMDETERGGGGGRGG